MTMQQGAPNTTTKRHFVWIGVVLVVGALIIGIMWSRSSDSDDLVEVATTTESARERTYLVAGEYPTRMSLSEASVGLPEENGVVVYDQVVGDEVFLNRISLMAPGWVAVKEIGGNVLGAARFDAGVWQGNVILLRSLESDRSYQALMYHDDGDGMFDLAKDSLILDESGAPITALFKAL